MFDSRMRITAKPGYFGRKLVLVSGCSSGIVLLNFDSYVNLGINLSLVIRLKGPSMNVYIFQNRVCVFLIRAVYHMFL